MKLFLLVVFCFFNLPASFSQALSDLQAAQNPDYINKLASKWSLRVYSVSKYNQFTFSGNDFTSSFKPDVKIAAGLGASYKNLSLDLAANIYSSDPARKSKNIGLLSSVYSDAHVMEIAVQIYHHFTAQVYDANDEKIFSRFRPDIRTFNLGINYNYNFNHRKFSFEAASIGTQIQKRSAGTPLAGFYVSYLDIAADSILISPALLQNNNDDRSFSEANLLSGGISAGYAYTFVLPGHCYILLSLSPKLGLHSAELKTNYYQNVPLSIAPGFLMRNAIGYAGTKIYSFLSVLADYNSVNIGSDNRIAYHPVKVKLLVGYRFN